MKNCQDSAELNYNKFIGPGPFGNGPFHCSANMALS